jgi:hypothetical protein
MFVKNEDLLRFLPPEGRHAYLDAAAVRRLVRKIRPGVDAPAFLEKRGATCRLRFVFHLRNGRRLRRGVTLPDSEIAAWLAGRLQKIREKRREVKLAGRRKRNIRMVESGIAV